MMVGREFKNWYPDRPTVPSGQIVLEVKGLLVPGAATPVSFEVRRGEIFAFLGPNGAGKTTTVEILEGFRAATAGTVEVLGTDPARAPAEWLILQWQWLSSGQG